jgi:hypothetical protein
MSIFLVIDFLSPAFGALLAQPPVWLIGAQHAAGRACGGLQRNRFRGVRAAHEGLCCSRQRRCGAQDADVFGALSPELPPARPDARLCVARSHPVDCGARRAGKEYRRMLRRKGRAGVGWAAFLTENGHPEAPLNADL